MRDSTVHSNVIFQGELRISVLPTHLTYGAPWPIRKVPLRTTPYHVAYDRENKVCVDCSYLPKYNFVRKSILMFEKFLFC